MRVQHSRILQRTAAVVCMWMTVAAATCGDLTSPEPIQGCSWTVDRNFPQGTSYSLNKPANCPLKLTGATSVDYAATIVTPTNGYLSPTTFFSQDIVSRTGHITATTAQAAWKMSPNSGDWFVNISGNYMAASGGFDVNNHGYDDVRNGFYSDIRRYATNRVAYSWGIPNNHVYSPQDVVPGQPYEVTAAVADPNFLGDVTWSWYVDDVLTAQGSVAALTIQAGAPYTQQSVRVLAQDSYGNARWGNVTVTTQGSCSGTDNCY